MAPILNIVEITDGKVSFETKILLFRFTPSEYNKAVQAVVPLANDSEYLDLK